MSNPAPLSSALLWSSATRRASREHARGCCPPRTPPAWQASWGCWPTPCALASCTHSNRSRSSASATSPWPWEILWALILGFALSAVVQALVRRKTITRLLGDDRPKTLAIAAGLGAASSSCSYAAVALARSLFRKGASFTAAMAFEIASTNLVIELGIILALLLGWQFTLAEFVGGPLMIVFLAVLFRLFLRQRLLEGAREQADRGLAGSVEGHAAMDMSIAAGGTFWQRRRSAEGFHRVSHI